MSANLGRLIKHLGEAVDEQITLIASLKSELKRLRGFEEANRLNAAQVAVQRAKVERLETAMTQAIRQHEEGNQGLSHRTLCDALYVKEKEDKT